MNILLLTRSLETGGAERQLVVLANALARRGHRVGVAVFYARGPLVQELERDRVTLHDLAKRGRWDALGFGVRLARLVRRERPDVIYSFMPVSNLVAAIAGRLVRPRPGIVWGVRVSFMDHSRYDWLSARTYGLERRLAPLADRIIANSEAGRRLKVAEGFRAGQVVVVPNGIDTARFVPARGCEDAAGRPVTVGLVGRIDPMKGHGTFLQAAAALHTEHRRLRFVCIGDGDPQLAGALQDQARRLGLEQVLGWRPAQQDMPAAYGRLDVLVSASDGEGFSNVIAEGMACGLPCVVTDVGDSARIVGEPRWVVPARDPEALAEAVRDLLGMAPAERRALGEANRQRIVERFSVERMVTDTEAVLRDAVASAAR